MCPRKRVLVKRKQQELGKLHRQRERTSPGIVKHLQETMPWKLMLCMTHIQTVDLHEFNRPTVQAFNGNAHGPDHSNCYRGKLHWVLGVGIWELCCLYNERRAKDTISQPSSLQQHWSYNGPLDSRVSFENWRWLPSGESGYVSQSPKARPTCKAELRSDWPWIALSSCAAARS